MAITVVIADDHPLVLQGIETIFTLADDIELLAQCRNGEEALDAVRRHRPDVLVLDLVMPERDGLGVLRTLSGWENPPKVILLTAALDEDDVLEAIDLGVRGVLLKEMGPEMLKQCVRKVAAGGQWLEKEVTNRAIQKLMQRQQAAEKINRLLTPRQIEIIKLAATGAQTKIIARTLHITEGTVKSHLHTIYEKLQLNGRMDLVRFAQAHQLM